MTTTQIIAVVIFVVTMAAIMTEKIHRTVAAVAGALLLLLTGVLTVDSAFSYVDINTIGVLVGMMLFVAVVKNSGLFEYIAIRAAKIANGHPWKLMVLFVLITAILSAFLDNVTTVLLIGPMTLAITNMLKINPIPFFMTQIMASNIGGTATLIGDPPNIMIGSAAGLSFVDFIANTGVAVVFVLAATLVCFYFIYGRKLRVEPQAMEAIHGLDAEKAIKDRPLLIKSVVVIVLVVLGFIFHAQLGLESCTIALTAAAVMLLITMSGPFSYAVTYCRLPQALANLIFGITNQPQLLMIIILVWLFILGMFLDSNVNFLLLTPIFLPMVQKVGFDPVHFGVLMATIVTMGVFTPPVGSAIYPVCSIIKCPVDEYTKEALPFFAAIFLEMVLLVFLPDVVMFLPNLVYGTVG